MAADNFFAKQSPESAAKTAIVTSFFIAWLNIIGNFKRYNGPLAFMELFSGPGKFDDGTKSTPLLILEHILSSPHARRFNVTLNEMDPQSAARLKGNIELLSNLTNL